MKLEKRRSLLLGDKVAIITGSGRGIGRAIALAFAQEGANIIVVARTLREIKETAEKIRKIGQKVLPIKADISKPKDVAKVVKETLQAFGKIDILVNNAGIQGPIGPLVKNEITDWVQTINVNLLGTFLCTKAVLPYMIKARSGKIINLSGGGATSPRPNFSAYACAKIGIVRLTETVAQEVEKFNIDVNAIAPGAINTRMLDEVIRSGKLAGKELEQAKKRKIDSGDSIENVARLAIFLASEKSNGFSGRLISAVHDDWRHFTKAKIKKLMNSDLYTLRRIDPYTLNKNKSFLDD